MFTKESNPLKLLRVLNKKGTIEVLDAMILLDLDISNIRSVIQNLNHHIGKGKSIIIRDYTIKFNETDISHLWVSKFKGMYSLISNNNNKKKRSIKYPYEIYDAGLLYRIIYNLFGIN